MLTHPPTRATRAITLLCRIPNRRVAVQAREDRTVETKDQAFSDVSSVGPVAVEVVLVDGSWG